MSEWDARYILLSEGVGMENVLNTLLKSFSYRPLEWTILMQSFNFERIYPMSMHETQDRMLHVRIIRTCNILSLYFTYFAQVYVNI